MDMQNIHLTPDDGDDLYSGYEYSTVADVREGTSVLIEIKV